MGSGKAGGAVAGPFGFGDGDRPGLGIFNRAPARVFRVLVRGLHVGGFKLDRTQYRVPGISPLSSGPCFKPLMLRMVLTFIRRCCKFREASIRRVGRGNRGLAVCKGQVITIGVTGHKVSNIRRLVIG